jgi:hypothetical protein
MTPAEQRRAKGQERLDREREERLAAVKIQAQYRGHRERIRFSERRRTERTSATAKVGRRSGATAEEDAAATRIQSAYRGHEDRLTVDLAYAKYYTEREALMNRGYVPTKKLLGLGGELLLSAAEKEIEARSPLVPRRVAEAYHGSARGPRQAQVRQNPLYAEFPAVPMDECIAALAGKTTTKPFFIFCP